MKKNIVLLIAFLVVILGVNSVYAISESQLKTKLTQSYEINGGKYYIGSELKVLAERYLDQYDVSEADCDYIAERIDLAVDILRNAGVVDARKLSAGEKNQLKKLVSEINANTSVKATVTKDAVVIYDENGNVFAEANRLVKQTDNNTNIMILAACLIAFTGIALIIRQARNN